MAAPVAVTGAAWSHVHNLAYDGSSLVLGTHGGLFRQAPGQPARQLSATGFDVMGLAHDGTRWLASGHPGADENLPADLGLRASADGRTWTTVSLLGEVDFHRLTAAGPTILGVSAHDRALLRSTDGGTTFVRITNPGAFDLALDPGNPTRALASAQTGLMATNDRGDTWLPVSGAPLLAFVAWTTDRVYGITPDGTVQVSTDGGASWTPRGTVGGQPGAAAAEGDRVAVLVGGSVLESTDGGATFTPRLTGIGGH